MEEPPHSSTLKPWISFFPKFLYRKQPQKHIKATNSRAPTVATALITSLVEFFPGLLLNMSSGEGGWGPFDGDWSASLHTELICFPHKPRFPMKEVSLKLTSEPSDGIAPVRKFMDTLNDVSLISLSRECGIDPLNVLLDKSLPFSFLNGCSSESCTSAPRGRPRGARQPASPAPPRSSSAPLQTPRRRPRR